MDHTGWDQRNKTKTNKLRIFPSLGRKLIIDWVKLRGSLLCYSYLLWSAWPLPPVYLCFSHTLETGDWAWGQL